MVRIVVQTCDCGMAANVGGSVESTVRTFDAELPELEAYLQEYESARSDSSMTKQVLYWHRNVIGVEVLGNRR